jgi:hypothetical protein
MNLRNYYWYFKSALSKKFCDELIKYGNSKKDNIGLIGNLKEKDNISKEQIKDLKKKRNSNIVWLDDFWIYKEIQPYINVANQKCRLEF